MNQPPERRPVVRQLAEYAWECPPHHDEGALSKMLVRPDVCGARHLDHRISTYRPGDGVRVHAHPEQEQIYHVLSGEGLLEIAGERLVVGAGTVAFVPPGVMHGINNTGFEQLVFLVITSPPDGPLELAANV
jgi:mannose-6-phosphate isomerase-like protein (cupin superfamily)